MTDKYAKYKLYQLVSRELIEDLKDYAKATFPILVNCKSDDYDWELFVDDLQEATYYQVIDVQLCFNLPIEHTYKVMKVLIDDHLKILSEYYKGQSVAKEKLSSKEKSKTNIF